MVDGVKRRYDSSRRREQAPWVQRQGWPDDRYASWLGTLWVHALVGASA